MLRSFRGHSPDVHPGAYVDDSAVVIGEVKLAEGASIWPGAVLRGDMGPITIGKNSSIQDNASCHCTKGQSVTTVGRSVSVGHGAVLHGCTVADNCVIGMNSVIMDNAEIGEWSIVAAGAVVTHNTKFPPNSIIAGVPAKLMKQADEKTLGYIKWNAGEYADILKDYMGGDDG